MALCILGQLTSPIVSELSSQADQGTQARSETTQEPLGWHVD